ncbi:hypothetical protein [Dyella sp. A6]|uniref:hypothetical protein n=1 Tax=Dyella aluminiiresistens TaxID=3069105 RepID=UPI002E79FF6F|nr:hypothetical protein [Dyella sp. A6]
MKSHAIATCVLASALLLPLAACSQSGQGGATASNGNPASASSSLISREIAKGMQKAKQELLTQDIDVDSIHIGHGMSDTPDNLPKAVITPQGDLKIAGKIEPATPEQHAMLLAYRTQLIGIADAGMDIGARGAGLGVSAAKEAILGAIAGKSDKQINAAIQPQTKGIQAAALQLCKRMPAVLATQQQLAANMPAFKPYATLTQKDVDDCGKDSTDQNGKHGVVIFSD